MKYFETQHDIFETYVRCHLALVKKRAWALSWKCIKYCGAVL